MVDVTQLLEEIGLTRSEIKVYLALLELGSSSTGPIVEKSGAASSKIYEVLEKLMQKGLASFVIKSGVKHFEAASPKRLLDYMNEKKKHVDDLASQVESLVPELEMKQALSEHKSETLVFKGLKGAQTAFDDILNRCSKGDALDVVGFSEIDETFQNFLIRFHRRRSRQGIVFRGLFGEKLQPMIDTLNTLSHSTVKVSLHESTMVGTLVYKDTVLFSIAKDKLWIQVRNQGLADTMRERFEIMWNETSQVYYGSSGVRYVFDMMLHSSDVWFIGGNDGLARYYPAYWKQYSKKRIDSKVMWHDLVDSKRMGNLFSGQKRSSVEYYEHKVLSAELSSPHVIAFWSDYVANIIWGKKTVITLIKDKKIVASYKKYFEYLWKLSSEK